MSTPTRVRTGGKSTTAHLLAHMLASRIYPRPVRVDSYYEADAHAFRARVLVAGVVKHTAVRATEVESVEAIIEALDALVLAFDRGVDSAKAIEKRGGGGPCDGCGRNACEPDQCFCRPCAFALGAEWARRVPS